MVCPMGNWGTCEEIFSRQLCNCNCNCNPTTKKVLRVLEGRSTPFREHDPLCALPKQFSRGEGLSLARSLCIPWEAPHNENLAIPTCLWGWYQVRFFGIHFGHSSGIGEGPGWHLVRYLCETRKALHERMFGYGRCIGSRKAHKDKSCKVSEDLLDGQPVSWQRWPFFFLFSMVKQQEIPASGTPAGRPRRVSQEHPAGVPRIFLS